MSQAAPVLLKRRDAAPQQPRDSAEEVDPTLIDRLLLATLEDPVHKLFTLKIEKELLRFAGEPQLNSLDFPPMAAFQRLVIHRVAGYFSLERTVQGQQGSYRRPISVYKTPQSFIPALQLADMVPREKEPVKKMKILARAPRKVQEPPAPVPQAAPAPKAFAKRERRPVIVSDEPTPSPPIDSESLNDRERAYAEARARIFNEPIEEALSAVAVSPPLPVEVKPALQEIVRPPVAPQQVDREDRMVQLPTGDLFYPNSSNAAAPPVVAGGYGGWQPPAASYGHQPHSKPYYPVPQVARYPYYPATAKGSYQAPHGYQHPGWGGPVGQYGSSAGLLYDYTDMNSVPAPSNQVGALPGHILEMNIVAGDIQNLHDPRLRGVQQQGGSIRILNRAADAHSRPLVVVIFPSAAAAQTAVQRMKDQTNSPYTLCPWSGKMK